MDNTMRLIARVHCPRCTAGATVVFVPELKGWRCAVCAASWEDTTWPR